MKNCKDCKHCIVPATTPMLCEAPQLVDVLDDTCGTQNNMAYCDSVRDFKAGCVLQALVGREAYESYKNSRDRWRGVCHPRFRAPGESRMGRKAAQGLALVLPR